MSTVHADVAQLRALLFCRGISDVQTAPTLYGVHDVRFAEEFPAKCPGLRLYASFETLRRDRIEYELVVRSPVARRQRIVYSGVTEEGRSRVVTFVVDLGNFDFEAAGRYAFALYASGILVGTSTLTLAVPATRPTTLQ